MGIGRYFNRERRNGARFPTKIEISLNLLSSEKAQLSGKSVSGEIKNLSLKGACVLLPRMDIEGFHLFMDTNSAEDKELILIIPSDDKEETLELPIRMKWYRDSEGGSLPFEAGVEFFMLSSTTRDKLKRFLKRN